MDQLNKASKEMQDMVVEGEVPEDIERAIIESVESLKPKVEGELRVSIRSSALQEDGDFSFAGQYSTFLNIPADSIPQKYKEVVASLFTPRAIFYYKSKGFQGMRWSCP